MRETRLWSWHLLVIPIIIVLLGAHFAVMHYAPVFYGVSVEEARNFETMIERGKSVAQLVLYILLLAAALYHGLGGSHGNAHQGAAGKKGDAHWRTQRVGSFRIPRGTHT